MIWLLAHDPAQASHKDFVATTQTVISQCSAELSFHADRLIRAAVQTILADLTPASHTIHKRVSRCPDFEYPPLVRCSSSFLSGRSPCSVHTAFSSVHSSDMGFADGPPNNTIKITRTIPTQIQNQPLVSSSFLTFQINTRHSFAVCHRGDRRRQRQRSAKLWLTTGPKLGAGATIAWQVELETFLTDRDDQIRGFGVQASTSRMPYLSTEQVWSGSPSRCCGTCESVGTTAESYSGRMASLRSWTSWVRSPDTGESCPQCWNMELLGTARVMGLWREQFDLLRT